jgi:hypothetical protein
MKRCAGCSQPLGSTHNIICGFVGKVHEAQTYETVPQQSIQCPRCGASEGMLHKENCPVIMDFQPTTKKETNPKDAVGVKKAPFSTISAPVLAEIGVAMLEGARKYGRHNYRVSGIRYSVYYDAALRHLTSWWEGADIDPDSGLSHITKALASLSVLRDAMIQGKTVDDRPPASPTGWEISLQKQVDDIFSRYPESKEAFTEIEHGKK